jgi:hypothetical protein
MQKNKEIKVNIYTYHPPLKVLLHILGASTHTFCRWHQAPALTGVKITGGI